MLTALCLPFAIMFLVAGIAFFLRRSPSRAHLTERDLKVQKGLRLTGIVLLAAGAVLAGVAWRMPPPDPFSTAVGFQVENGVVVPVQAGETKQSERQQETMGGKGLELLANIYGFFHGRNLLYSLAGVCAGSSLVCFFVAKLQSIPPRRE